MEEKDSRKGSEESYDLGNESNIGLASDKLRVTNDPKRDLETGPKICKRRAKGAGCSRVRFKGEKLIVALTVAGVAVGILLGFTIKLSSDPSPTTITLVMFPGELLMRMLKMLIIPIIATSIVTGLANLDMKKSGRMGGYAVFYYMLTTVLAVILGIVLVILIHPGDPNQRKNLGETKEETKVSTLDTYLDLVRNIFPENIVAACFEVVRIFYCRS